MTWPKCGLSMQVVVLFVTTQSWLLAVMVLRSIALSFLPR